MVPLYAYTCAMVVLDVQGMWLLWFCVIVIPPSPARGLPAARPPRPGTRRGRGSQARGAARRQRAKTKTETKTRSKKGAVIMEVGPDSGRPAFKKYHSI